MDDIVAKNLAELAANLTALAVKGTVSSVNTKIKSIKLEKNLEEVKNKYDEIVNELLSEREEAVRIAQVYKSEIERYQISDDDISHLHKTVESLLEIVQNMTPGTDTRSLEQIKNLISVDTLKSIQLLGFNYKEAIGEPLTSICANAIKSWGTRQNSNRDTQQNSNKRK
jgi:hypothetical protein